MWTFEELLRSRVHRKLRDCPRFSRALPPETDFFINLEGEQVIGCYSFEDTDRVVVTTRGIRTRLDQETQFIPYSEMIASTVTGDWHVPAAKTMATQIQITMKDESSRQIRVRGGEGRLRDIWLFQHFLSHAINDYKKYAPGATRSG